MLVLFSLSLSAVEPACKRVASNDFCVGVTYEASLPLPAAELDASARSDYDLALGKLQKAGAQGAAVVETVGHAACGAPRGGRRVRRAQGSLVKSLGTPGSRGNPGRP